MSFCSYVLRGAQKMAALCLLTVLVLFLVAGSTIFVIVGACSVIVFSHAVAHVAMGPALSAADGGAGGDDDVELALVTKAGSTATADSSA